MRANIFHRKVWNLCVWKALLTDCLLCLLLVQGRSILTFTLLFSCFQGCTWKSSCLGLAWNGFLNLHKSILAGSKRSPFFSTSDNISHESIKLIIHTCTNIYCPLIYKWAAFFKLLNMAIIWYLILSFNVCYSRFLYSLSVYISKCSGTYHILCENNRIM